MLTPHGPDIWTLDGPAITAAAGFHYPTRMVVIRLAEGGLFLWSPVAFTQARLDAVAALGPIRHIVAPNHLHHMAMGDWAAACPEAVLHGASGLREKRPDLALDHVLGDTPHPDWDDQIDQITLPGNRITTETVFFHRASGTAVFADMLQQLPRGWYRGWRALVARLDLMTGDTPQVPRKFRIAFRDKPAARAAVERILDWPVTSVIIAHGPPVTSDAHAFLRRAFDWL